MAKEPEKPTTTTREHIIFLCFWASVGPLWGEGQQMNEWMNEQMIE